MKKKRFSVEQIVGVLKQAEVGVPIGELVRQVGISEQTFYRWKKRYAKLENGASRPSLPARTWSSIRSSSRAELGSGSR